jgi:CrcB protein
MKSRLREQIAPMITFRRGSAFKGSADDVVVFCPWDRASNSGRSPSVRRARVARLAPQVEVAHRGAGDVARSTRVLTPTDSALAMPIFVGRSADSFLQAHLSGRKKAFRPHDLEPVLAISACAAGGALVRGQLGVRLNSLFPGLPPGTLAANLIGGYIIGLAIAYLAQAPNLAPEWRLRIITVFCGGLTTFSTEVVTHPQERSVGLGDWGDRNARDRVASYDIGRFRNFATAKTAVTDKS